MANGGAAAGRRRCRDSLQHSFSHDYRPFTLLPSPLLWASGLAPLSALTALGLSSVVPASCLLSHVCGLWSGLCCSRLSSLRAAGRNLRRCFSHGTCHSHTAGQSARGRASIRLPYVASCTGDRRMRMCCDLMCGLWLREVHL